MYRHLLVPLDDSPLSVDTVSRAVELARALGAKVTFFHARADYGATSMGALERVISPAVFNEGVAGEARGIVAKAQVVARAAGIEHDAVVVTSDRPHEAILDAAAARGCDLIFMASHGRRGIRGLMLGSQTERVLHNTTIPVLVSSVEANVADPNATAALAALNDEHRSLAAVILGLEHLVREARDRGAEPQFPLLKAILHYILEFPEKLHHPKEEAYLFAKLRLRTSEFDATLDELARQHESGHEAVLAMDRALAAYEADPVGGLEAFAAAVTHFAATEWPHMSLENKVIFPAARMHLTGEDWKEIAAAFAANGDPRFSVDNDEEFRSLFARILNLVPPAAVGAATHRRS